MAFVPSFLSWWAGRTEICVLNSCPYLLKTIHIFSSVRIYTTSTFLCQSFFSRWTTTVFLVLYSTGRYNHTGNYVPVRISASDLPVHYTTPRQPKQNTPTQIKIWLCFWFYGINYFLLCHSSYRYGTICANPNDTDEIQDCSK